MEGRSEADQQPGNVLATSLTSASSMQRLRFCSCAFADVISTASCSANFSNETCGGGGRHRQEEHWGT